MTKTAGQEAQAILRDVGSIKTSQPDTPTFVLVSLATVTRTPPAEAHEKWCDEGWIYTEEGAARCPYCDHENEAAKFQQAIRDAGMNEYHDVTWDDLTPNEPLRKIRKACERLPDIRQAGHNLLLYGPPGTGKTQAAILILREALQRGMTAQVLNIGFASMQIRDGYGDGTVTEHDIVESARRPDFLLIDDLGAGETGRGSVESRILYAITQYRMERKRPTVLTTNLEPAELGQRVGGRIANRLLPLERIKFDGPNYRTTTPGTLWSET